MEILDFLYIASPGRGRIKIMYQKGPFLRQLTAIPKV
jgi:hypothetical protein